MSPSSLYNLPLTHPNLCSPFSRLNLAMHSLAIVALLRNLIKLAKIHVVIQETSTPNPWRIMSDLNPITLHNSLRAVLGVVLLAHSEGDISVLDHVLDLLSHWDIIR